MTKLYSLARRPHRQSSRTSLVIFAWVILAWAIACFITPDTSLAQEQTAPVSDDSDLFADAPKSEANAEKKPNASEADSNAETDADTDVSVPSTSAPQALQAPASAPGPTSSSTAPAPQPRVAKKNSRYTKAMFFAPEDNGASLSSPQIEWLLSDGARANLGGLKFDAAQIDFNFEMMDRSKLPRRLHNPEQLDKVVMNISMHWPESLTTKGTFSIETTKGKVEWSRAVSEEDREDWKEIFDRPDSGVLRLHAKAQWGLIDAPKDLAFLLKPVAYRACLTEQGSEQQQLRICTSPFQVRKGPNGIYQLARSKPREASAATVVIGKKAIGAQGIVNFKPGRPIRLQVLFANRSSVSISSQPLNLKLLDAVQSPSGREIVLTGQGLKPLGRVIELTAQESHFWSATGWPKELIWQLTLPKEAPVVRVLGAFNLPFSLIFKFKSLPFEADRVYLQDWASEGTYSSSPVLQGWTATPAQVSSPQIAAKNKDSQTFEWTFAAPKSGETNRALLTAKGKDGQSWIVHHSLYRGHPYEASGRLTGVATTSGQMVFLGELSASAWFESLASSQNRWFSRQRWGLTGRYFQAFTPIQLGNAAPVTTFNVWNLDLKYNLLPGIWNHDELVGLIMSDQQVNLASFSANVVGGGIYWARTMPKVFDDLFNLAPFMRYRKYVDLELIYYPLAIDSNIVAGTSFALNFHGKVFWSQNFFGEAGFGSKRYEFTDKAQNKSLSYQTFYGTAGLGFQF